MTTTYSLDQLHAAFSAGAQMVQAATLRDPVQDWLRDWSGASDPGAVSVTYNSALTYSSVWAAVSMISGDIASLPFHVYRVSEDGDRDVARQHPADWLLNDTPNELMDALTLRETLQSHALLFGNGYAAIEFDRAERPNRLIPLAPDMTMPKLDDEGNLFYENRDDQGVVLRIPSRDVLHIKGLTWNGLAGHSVISLARKSWGLGMAEEQHGNTAFANGARPSIVLETESRLSKEEADLLLARWEERHAGAENQNRPAIMSHGLKVHPFSMSNEDAQWLESRKFQRVEVAAWFQLPPHKLGDDSRLSYNSIESEEKAYINQTLRRWLSKWESECSRKLLANRMRRAGTLTMRHDTDEFVSADIETQVDVLVKLRAAEVVNRNEIRRKLGMPNTGPEGDDYSNPNTRSPEQQSEPATEPDSEEMTEARAAMRRAMAHVWRNLVKSESDRATGAAQRSKDFVGWIDGFYETWTQKVSDAMEPLITAYSALPGSQCTVTADQLSLAHAQRSKDELLAAAGVAMDREELRVHVSETVETWVERAEEMANQICEVTYVSDR